MDCPTCKVPLNKDHRCLSCNFDVNRVKWVIIKKVNTPNEIIVESFLQSYGIPVRLIRKEVIQMPVSIGPFAEVKIAVPESAAAAALDLINNLDAIEDIDDIENIDDQ